MSSDSNFAVQFLTSQLADLMDLSSSEVAALTALPTQIISAKNGETILRAGAPSLQWLLVLKGFVSTSKEFEDGKRQILSLYVPGDMPTLMSRPGRMLDVDVTAVGACRLAATETGALLDVCRRFPRIGELLWDHTLAMASLYREWIVNVGHRPAVSRVAHLLCEIVARLEARGLAPDKSCDLPLTQIHMSQATGLSRIHVNRACQELKRKALLSFENGRLVIYDWTALARLAQFSSEYLYLPDAQWIGSLQSVELQA